MIPEWAGVPSGLSLITMGGPLSSRGGEGGGCESGLDGVWFPKGSVREPEMISLSYPEGGIMKGGGDGRRP